MTDLPVSLILWVLFLHLVGDFFLQSNAMAVNKSKNTLVGVVALLEHVCLVTATLAVGGGLWMAATGRGTVDGLIQFAAANGLAHLVTDFVTGRVNSALWFIDLEPRPLDTLRTGNYAAFPLFAKFNEPKRHWFFVGIGVDQYLHVLVYIPTAAWWLA